MRFAALLAALTLAQATLAGVDFDFGADLRIRQEIMDNVPGLPEGGRASAVVAGKYKNWIRFRPRVWGELKGVAFDGSVWRLNTRLTDEFRWTLRPSANQRQEWPGELILDNLFIEGKGLWDGLVDLSLGRRDSVSLFGLERVFYDGTPLDGSRAMYMDLATVGFNFEDDRRLDLFGTYNSDYCDLRLARRRNRTRALTGLGGAEPEMDDWGFGAIWSDRLAENVPMKLFAMEKNTMAYHHPKYGKRPSTHRTLFGAKVSPKFNEEWSLDLEAMAEVGWNGAHDVLYGESAYAGLNWKEAGEGVRQFSKLGYRFMSGDKNAADEDGGHGAWDPMWSRGPTEYDLYLWGSPYGTYYWSNMHYLKLTYGVEFAPLHYALVCTGPVFAAAKDGMGGGNGVFEGFSTQLKYGFPIYTNISSYIQFELFNPSDYYKSDKPAYYVRWQIDFKF